MNKNKKYKYLFNEFGSRERYAKVHSSCIVKMHKLKTIKNHTRFAHQ